jgi:N-acetylmuramoyl-L-alanine amidase
VSKQVLNEYVDKLMFIEFGDCAQPYVALDAGHGTNTLGKGVPTLKEHDFNATVVKYAKEMLEYNGIKVLLTQPLFGKDVALSTRTNLANKEKVDLFLSVHADANGDKDARGHWGFYWKTSTSGKKMADLWYNELMAVKDEDDRITSRKNSASYRGQWNNFHVLRETYMPAVLMEHAFMTNAKDLVLLKSDDFRKKSAEALTRAVCKYFGKAYKEKSTPKPSTSKPTAPTGKLYKVQVGAFGQKSNADNLVKTLEKQGHKPFVKLVDKLYKVQVGAFSVKSNAESLKSQLEKQGHKPFITLE